MNIRLRSSQTSEPKVRYEFRAMKCMMSRCFWPTTRFLCSISMPSAIVSALRATRKLNSSRDQGLAPMQSQHKTTDIPSLVNSANLALLKDQCANGVPLKLRSAIPIEWPLSFSISPAILRREPAHLIREQIARQCIQELWESPAVSQSLWRIA
jgi:hypothetical protein